MLKDVKIVEELLKDRRFSENGFQNELNRLRILSITPLAARSSPAVAHLSTPFQFI